MRKVYTVINDFAYLSSGFVVVKIHQAPSVSFDLPHVQKPTREPNIKF